MSTRAAPSPPLAASAEQAKLAQLAARLSIAAAILLICIKGGVYSVAQSASLFASLIDSGLDLAASILTLIAVRFAAKPPDDNHGFGHGKAEAMAGLFQSGLVFAGGLACAIDAIQHAITPQDLARLDWALGVMLASILITGLLVTAQTLILRRINSLAIAGDRAHYLTDFLSNGAALIGLGLAAIGFGWADPLAGLAVGLGLIWTAIGLGRETIDHLMDHEMAEADRARIFEIVRAEPGVIAPRRLRTRLSGPDQHIDLIVALDPTASLQQADAILGALTERLQAAFPRADIALAPAPATAADVAAG